MRTVFIFMVVVFTCLGTGRVLASDTLVIRSSPSNCMYAYIDGGDPGCYYHGNSLIIADWTDGGVFYSWRFLLQFDLSVLPPYAIVDSAYLSLYANPVSPSGSTGSPTYGTANASAIYRVTSPWDTTTLSWADQPSYTNVDSAVLQESTSTVENYLNVNVTGMVQQMLFSESNYGFIFKHLQEEVPYNSMIFYSPYVYSSDSLVTPVLMMTYHFPTGVANLNASSDEIKLFPNPVRGATNVSLPPFSGKAVIELVNGIGDVVNKMDINGDGQSKFVTFENATLPAGVYVLKFATASKRYTQKLVVE
jgi:Secretion system C-terminal sorting domain